MRGSYSVGASRKVTSNGSQETMTCHSFNCFSIVWCQSYAPLVTSRPKSCYMTLNKLAKFTSLCCLIVTLNNHILFCLFVCLFFFVGGGGGRNCDFTSSYHRK